MSTTPPASGHPADASAGGMIDFGCGSCGRLLKVPAQAAGKQARCPQCGAVQQVPAGRTAPVARFTPDGSGSTAARHLLFTDSGRITADRRSAACPGRGTILRTARPSRGPNRRALVVAPASSGRKSATRRTGDTDEEVVRPHHAGSRPRSLSAKRNWCWARWWRCSPAATC